LEWDEFGDRTPLIATIEAGQEQFVKLLIKYGAWTEAMGTDGYGFARDNAALFGSSTRTLEHIAEVA
jgi:hypothetical protein